MTKAYRTEQEDFWVGDFGDAYIERNTDPHLIAYRTALFARVLGRTHGITSILEFGANVGQNLLAIRHLKPDCRMTGIEINNRAAQQLESMPDVRVLKGSILDFSPEDLGNHDLTFTAGVLIHINPDLLQGVYRRLYECSKSYICLIEYYNPTPVGVTYRGHSERLFKRDFAGEILDLYSDLELLDYGFQYHRDNNFPLDDCTWFLLRKRNG